MNKRLTGAGLPAGQGGFSLVEICLAMLVVAIGLVTLMSLFPVGLREVESAVQNTRAAMFADDKFNSFQATNALMAETIADFENQTLIFGNVPTGDDQVAPNVVTNNGNVLSWKYFVRLNTTVPSTPVWRVRLEVQNGKSAQFTDPVVFYTELIYGAPSP
jgi:type II secretory pathway pseudopilin PulG